MADTGRLAETPLRVPGAARTGPASPVALDLSEELRQRIQATVQSELTQAAADDQSRVAEDWPTELSGRDRLPESAPSKEAGLEGSGAPADGTDRKHGGAAAAVWAATLERIAWVVPRGHMTKGPGSAVEPQPAVGGEPVVKVRLATEPEPEARPVPERPRRRFGARPIALGLALIVVGTLTAVGVDHFSPSPATVRAQTAAWVAEQVSPDVTVSCDAVMCAALQAHGFPVSKLVVLGPTSPDPVSSVLVVETATVREWFGSSLAIAWAPAVLASFGSGAGAITVRVVAPDGPAAYQAALNADLANRKTSGAALLHNSQVAVSATARGQLLAGEVDLRLLLAFAAVAEHEPMDIVRFGNLGPGASPGVLLGFADLAESIPAAHMDTVAYVRAVCAVLNGVDARIRPVRAISGPVQGQAILRVEFASPSPLGNFGSGSP